MTFRYPKGNTSWARALRTEQTLGWRNEVSELGSGGTTEMAVQVQYGLRSGERDQDPGRYNIEFTQREVPTN